MPRLSFKGKVFVENHHLAVPFHELLPVREKGLSEKASLRDNLVVHGDNLAALKSLLPTYHGQVGCVYIDPPYNTGNERWVYNDNVNSPLMQDWLGRVDRLGRQHRPGQAHRLRASAPPPHNPRPAPPGPGETALRGPLGTDPATLLHPAVGLRGGEHRLQPEDAANDLARIRPDGKGDGGGG